MQQAALRRHALTHPRDTLSSDPTAPPKRNQIFKRTISKIQPDRERSTRSERVESSRSGVTPHRQQACARVSSLALHMPASNRPRPGSAAPDPSRYTRSVALHPIRRATPDPSRYTRSVALHLICRGTPDQKRCNANGSGAVPPQQEQKRATTPPHTPYPALPNAATQPRHARPSSKREALHQLRKQCTT